MIPTIKLGPQFPLLFNQRFLFPLLTEDVMDAALNCVILSWESALLWTDPLLQWVTHGSYTLYL